MTYQIKSALVMTCWINLTASVSPSWMATIAEELGQKIAVQRRAVGLTQARLAEKIDVQPETISRVETGKRTASLDLLERIADALDLELHELFRAEEKENPRSRAIEKLLWFAQRLSPAEIELVMDVGSAVLKHTRDVTSG
jgi:transcriptional regulator with XRE-family HTH domain